MSGAAVAAAYGGVPAVQKEMTAKAATDRQIFKTHNATSRQYPPPVGALLAELAGNATPQKLVNLREKMLPEQIALLRASIGGEFERGIALGEIDLCNKKLALLVLAEKPAPAGVLMALCAKAAAAYQLL